MMLNEFIIDYSLINQYIIDELKRNIILPIKDDEFHRVVAVCLQSNEETFNDMITKRIMVDE